MIERTNKFLTVCLVVAGGLAVSSVVVAADTQNLSDDERRESVSRSIASMKQTLSVALERLSQAREGQDVIQLNCVNEKLSAINGLVKISETASKSLKEAIAKQDDELNATSFQK